MKKTDKLWLMPLLVVLYFILTPYVYGLSLLQFFKNAQVYAGSTWNKVKVILCTDFFKQTHHAYYKFQKTNQE